VIADGRVFAPLKPVKLAELRRRFWGGPHQRPLAAERILDFLKSPASSWR
jgi:hypothetical protein